HAHGPDDAVEKLARNRRIDAVLILCCAENERIMEAIREDLPAAPPVFLPATDQTLQPGTRLLSPGDPDELLDKLVRELEEGSATRGKVKV
ncbi:MAG TPA: hypothetical protein VLO07_05785, partial [Thermoanaerobaculia bacterium]|nr:hypothetical protein [Thermoanaerobaculia bacterium]